MTANDIEQARFNMVAQQIRPWEVIDQRVLDTLNKIPREHFVPADQVGLAFADIEVPIGHGQHMMCPRLEARMLQALDIQPGERVLEIGTGSGFITACLCSLSGNVTSIDIEPDFVEQASARLAALDINSATLQQGDIFATTLEEGVWDVIAVTGSVGDQIESLQHLLAPNGRLFAVTGRSPAMEATLVTRVGEDAFRREDMFETELAPLLNLPQKRDFEF